MKQKNFKLSAILIVALFIFSSCGFFSSLDSRALAESPLAPEIVAAGSSSRNVSRIVSSDDQNFGSFGMIQASAWNYNSMIDETVPQGITTIEGGLSIESTVSYGPLIKKIQSFDIAFFENEDATITTFLQGGEGESRQFDAYILDDNVKYSRCYFYWPTNLFSYLGVDITEVWEYPNRKEVSVTLFNRDTGNVDKFLAVTDTSDELQRTSFFHASHTVNSGTFTLDSYDQVGYIDFNIVTALEDTYAEKDSFLPVEYPSVNLLEDLHNKSFDLNNIDDVIIDYENLVPYISFLE